MPIARVVINASFSCKLVIVMQYAETLGAGRPRVPLFTQSQATPQQGGFLVEQAQPVHK